MSHENPQHTLWGQVDSYFIHTLRNNNEQNPLLLTLPQSSQEKKEPFDPLEYALQNSEKNGLPPHQVSPNQGQFLSMLVMMTRSKRILEIGTLGAYSTIWLAWGLIRRQQIFHDTNQNIPGQIISLESNPLHVKVARENIEFAQLVDLIQVREGNALQSLHAMTSGQETIEPFDLIFIDADKPNNPSYLEYALKLSRVGTVIIGDNVVRNGQVANSESQDANVLGVRQFMANMGNKHAKKLVATAMQTVGCKGYDGFSMAMVVEH
ncbi:hypothetical protein C9374_008048 [Naegleria lovaniensis]|uniref:O-methyltransferase n=1 Tax=Naegleria lovaniensis TaxID=51637 RepID=A0AA88GKT5_NAELO|nr:uncharacterized protein C9374_008048 [Naegleria lovaniensis]KAG2378900.1 hypothetical protein C9374_008048 [Naegleria lovaniensis]